MQVGDSRSSPVGMRSAAFRPRSLSAIVAASPSCGRRVAARTPRRRAGRLGLLPLISSWPPRFKSVDVRHDRAERRALLGAAACCTACSSRGDQTCSIRHGKTDQFALHVSERSALRSRATTHQPLANCRDRRAMVSARANARMSMSCLVLCLPHHGISPAKTERCYRVAAAGALATKSATVPLGFTNTTRHNVFS